MTEPEWLACADPTPMLEILRGKASDRKLRLFAVACCRHILRMFNDDVASTGLEVVERYANGQATPFELDAAAERMRNQVAAPREECWFHAAGPDAHEATLLTVESALWLIHDTAYMRGVGLGEQGAHKAALAAESAESVVQAAFIRDIVGPILFRPIRVSYTWLQWNDATVPRIAQFIYDGRDFSLLPILADALEEAGCDHADILNHCRQPGEHVRGCWVLDLLLGKS